MQEYFKLWTYRIYDRVYYWYKSVHCLLWGRHIRASFIQVSLWSLDIPLSYCPSTCPHLSWIEDFIISSWTEFWLNIWYLLSDFHRARTASFTSHANTTINDYYKSSSTTSTSTSIFPSKITDNTNIKVSTDESK